MYIFRKMFFIILLIFFYVPFIQTDFNFVNAKLQVGKPIFLCKKNVLVEDTYLLRKPF